MKIYNRELLYVLFAKGWFDIPNEKYWQCLHKIAEKYSGIEAKYIINENMLYHTTKIVDKYCPDKLEVYNEQLLMNMRMYSEKSLSVIQLMIITNLSLISRITNDKFPEGFMLTEEKREELVEQLIKEI